MLFFPVYMASNSRQLFSFSDPAVVFPSLSPHPRAPFKSFRMNTSKSVSKQMTLTPFRMNTYEKQGGGAHFAQFWCNVSPFRMNTCKSVSKQSTLTPFRMNTYEKRGGGGCLSLSCSSSRSLNKERRTSPLHSDVSALFLKTAGCGGILHSGNPKKVRLLHPHGSNEVPVANRFPSRLRVLCDLCVNSVSAFQLSTFNFRPLPPPTSHPRLPAVNRELSPVESVHRDPAHQLRIKIGGLLWHDFAGSRDLHHLLDVARIQQKRNLRAPAVHGVERRQGFSLIRQVRLRRHRLRRDSQRRLQDSFVQQHHVQLALQRRNIRQQLRQVDAFAQRQHVECALLGPWSRIHADGPFRASVRESCKKFRFRLGPLPAAREWKFLRRKPRLQMPPHRAPGKIVNVRRHAMPRQNQQPFAPRIDERHHRALVRSLRIGLSRMRAALVPVIQRCLIAMMPVGDHQLLAFHRSLNRGHALRLRNHPQPVQNAIFVAH